MTHVSPVFDNPPPQRVKKASGFDDKLLAHLAAGYKEAVDDCYGKEGFEADFPPELAINSKRDYGAMRVANMIVAAEAGLLREQDIWQLPKPDVEPVSGKGDAVNLPDHYARFNIEPIRFIGENKLGFLPGNVIKYVLRWDAKDGIQDLYKAKRYLEMMIAYVEGNPDWWKVPSKPFQRPPEGTAHAA